MAAAFDDDPVTRWLVPAGRSLDAALRRPRALGARRPRLDRSRPAGRGAGGGGVLGPARLSCPACGSSPSIPFYARALRPQPRPRCRARERDAPGPAARGVLVPRRGRRATTRGGDRDGAAAPPARTGQRRGVPREQQAREHPPLRALRLRAPRRLAAARRSELWPMWRPADRSFRVVRPSGTSSDRLRRTTRTALSVVRPSGTSSDRSSGRPDETAAEGPAVRRGGDADVGAQVGAQRGGGAHAGASATSSTPRSVASSRCWA